MISQDVVKGRIESLLTATKRSGVENLIKFLRESDYFHAPACSGTQHNEAEQVVGGLALHSLRVYEVLFDKVQLFNVDIPPEAISITALLHDLCKVNYYYHSTRWQKDAGGRWQEIPCWKVKDEFPMGHGEKSAFLAQRYIPLTDVEALMIRWHMGAYEAGINFQYPTGYSYYGALDKYPGVRLLATADNEAAYLIRKGSDLW